jgi:lipopolysaccharide export system protein LptA
MIAPAGRYRAIALIIASLIGAPALAVEKTSSVPLLPGSNSKDPISIDADKLEYFDKEQKAIYTGNVVAIQGDSKLTCSVMILFLAKNPPQPTAGAPASDAAGAGPSSGGTQVKHMDATGPVTVVSKTQVATGDRGSYDKDQNKVWLFGNVTLSDGGNVTKGDKLTYDLTSGEAVVEAGKTAGADADKTPSRVHGQFIPGSNNPAADATDNSPAAKKAPDAKSGVKPKPKPKPKAPVE